MDDNCDGGALASTRPPLRHAHAFVDLLRNDIHYSGGCDDNYDGVDDIQIVEVMARELSQYGKKTVT